MILLLVIILFLLLCLIGGNRGALSFIVLMANTFIMGLTLFFLSRGFNSIIVIIVSSLAFCMVTVIYQNEYNIKSLVSMISVLIILILMVGIIYTVCTNGHVSGLNEIEKYEDSNQFISSAVSINLFGIYLAMMVFGELGAVIDTSISISTSMNEISRANPGIGKLNLFKSGMIIGKDILGTTVNTLFFVAMGESVMLMLYYMHYGYSFIKLINSKSFFQEVSVLLFSSIGCVLIIPITSLVFVYFVKNNKIKEYFDKREHEEEELVKKWRK